MAVKLKLEDIGFYTLSDDRCKNASLTSPMWRCELILTDVCNFKCPYCRGLKDELCGTMPLDKAKSIIDIWAKDGLKNIRFSGGEPTLYPHIKELVAYTKSKGVERIAISTNGSNRIGLYYELIDAGVSDFSISLDACCQSTGDMMAGVNNAWIKVVETIRTLAKLTYVTIGIVYTDQTKKDLSNTVKFAHSLGVADIRIISAAQYDKNDNKITKMRQSILNKHPILQYRINNLKTGRSVRGIADSDSNKCPLVIDDCAVAGNYHFPCIIYLREQGQPIGIVSSDMRKERYQWFLNHNTHNDPICRKNCLDVCIDYNNKFRDLHAKTD